MNKIIFPFYKISHRFLMKKWWFRTIFAIYILLFVIFVPLSWYGLITDSYNRCVSGVESYYGGEPDPVKSISEFNEYYDSLNNCNYAAKTAWGSWEVPTAWVLVVSITIHYLLQLVFFKIIIDFIVLGNHLNSKDNN